MQGIGSKEAILVELLNDHIDVLNNGIKQDISEELASLPTEDRAEMRSLLSIDRLLRMVAAIPLPSGGKKLPSGGDRFSPGGEKNRMLDNLHHPDEED